jgi:hypothetical protein
MQKLYFILAALHIVSLFVTGILWTIIDIWPQSNLKKSFRDIRAVHFGSLYLVPWFLGLAYAFERLKVPTVHQLVFPCGLAALVTSPGSATCSLCRPAWTRFITGRKDGVCSSP